MKKNLPLVLIALASALTFSACDSNDAASIEQLERQLEAQERLIEEQRQMLENYAQLSDEYQSAQKQLLEQIEEQERLQKQLSDRPENEKRVNDQLSDKLEQNQATAAQQNQKTPKTTTAAADKYIGADKAKSIALEHAGVTADSARWLKAEFEIDDRLPIYEIDFKSGGYEYEYDIDASSGKIIKSEKDRDD